MKNHFIKRISATVLSVAVIGTAFFSEIPKNVYGEKSYTTAYAFDRITLADMPQNYNYAADWIWNTRIVGEGSVVSHATIYDQIIAGKGTLNYIIRWQSYKNITLQQRKQLQQVLETAVNDWNKWLAGYENWPYEHVNVNVVGWAVLDKNCLLDLQPDETVYTDIDEFDPSGDINAGMADSTMLNLMPRLPVEIYRYEHWNDPDYQYPGGYENRFDMHLTASTGLIDMGGYGYYWGQQLSDNAILGLADGSTSVHILEHEIGHGFGFTDFYGAEGASDGTPPGGFPDGKGSIMEAGSSSVITDFDGWFARYVWTKISAEEDRFDLTDVPAVTEPPTEPPTEPTVTEPTISVSFIDTIEDVGSGYVTFAEHGTFTYDNTYYGNDESKNLAYYEAGDKVDITFSYQEHKVIAVEKLVLIHNSHEPEKVTGDVNTDGVFSLADILIMQKWLLAVPDVTLNDWKTGDLNADDKINVFDLCLMKRKLIDDNNN